MNDFKNFIPNPASPLKQRPGFKCIASFDKDVEQIVGLCEYKGRVIVATSCRVLEVVGDELKQIPLYEENEHGKRATTTRL